MKEILIILLFALAALTSILLYCSFAIKPFQDKKNKDKEKRNHWVNDVFAEAPTSRAHQGNESNM